MGDWWTGHQMSLLATTPTLRREAQPFTPILSQSETLTETLLHELTSTGKLQGARELEQGGGWQRSKSQCTDFNPNMTGEGEWEREQTRVAYKALQLKAALETIDACARNASERKARGRRAVELFYGEQLEAATSTTDNTAIDGPIHSVASLERAATKLLGAKVTAGSLGAKLRKSGDEGLALARRLGGLTKARIFAAHPDQDIVTDVLEFLRTTRGDETSSDGNSEAQPNLQTTTVMQMPNRVRIDSNSSGSVYNFDWNDLTASTKDSEIKAHILYHNRHELSRFFGWWRHGVLTKQVFSDVNLAVLRRHERIQQHWAVAFAVSEEVLIAMNAKLAVAYQVIGTLQKEAADKENAGQEHSVSALLPQPPQCHKANEMKPFDLDASPKLITTSGIGTDGNECNGDENFDKEEIGASALIQQGSESDIAEEAQAPTGAEGLSR